MKVDRLLVLEQYRMELSAQLKGRVWGSFGISTEVARTNQEDIPPSYESSNHFHLVVISSLQRVRGLQGPS
jgi:hypothetical protein